MIDSLLNQLSDCYENDFFDEVIRKVEETEQELYIELVDKKCKIEEQLKDISMALSDMEEQLIMLKSREEPTSESDMPATLLPAPTRVLVAVGNEEETEEEEGHENSEKKAERTWPAAEERAAKIERLKSGFRIRQPPHQEDDHIVVPTPSSACSSSSLVKPLAERRPISPATLTHVTVSFPLINLNEAPPN